MADASVLKPFVRRKEAGFIMSGAGLKTVTNLGGKPRPSEGASTVLHTLARSEPCRCVRMAAKGVE